MTIVAPKHVHVILVDDAGVRMPRAGTTLRIHGIQLLPRSRLNTVLVEVVNSIVAIVSPKDVDAPTVHNCSVSVTGAGRL